MIALIAALSTNRCIGTNGQLPWHIPGELARFKTLTMGKTVLMGRKTWESLPEKFRPLPGRTNVVVTRQPRYDVPRGVIVHTSVDDALAMLADAEVMVIGGAEIYAQTIGRADTLHLTHVHREVAGDVFFPIIDPAMWQESAREDHDGFAFVTYGRTPAHLTIDT